MIIEFKFRNFCSFKDETHLLMTSVKSFKDHLNTNVIKTNRDFDLLKTAAIYGSNAAGKSNLIKAISGMNWIIFSSFRNSLLKEEEKLDQNFQFKLNSSSEKDNVMFEVSFILESILYRYGFEINGFEIKKEWLFRKIEREVPLFTREEQEFEINQESFIEGEKYKTEVNSNVLFLSHLSQNNQVISKQILGFFAKINVISGLHEQYYQKYTAKLLGEDNNFKNWAASVLKYLEISNIEAGEKDDEIITYHRKYDKNNLFLEAVPFDKMMESDGTKKLIHILGPIYDTLRRGRILFFDEFDSKLHPNLTRKLIEFFHRFNLNNAQIIFSALDPGLMDNSIFRRDQIWFVEKDQFGVSKLYSLSDFSAKAVRNSSAYDKKYLQNEFGAADTLDITDKITELLYEQA
ncbi:MAG TPA: ATP-binding protein [Puia sp.]|nr:ATP-binding protein [Puia sp.]